MNNKFTKLSRDKCIIKGKLWGVWIELTTYNWKFIPTIELDLYGGFLYGGFLSIQFLCFGIKLFCYGNKKRKPKRRKWRYKWNAILDKNTCKNCSTLHGKIFTKEELRNSHPPLHGLDKNNQGCRCYLTLTK